MNLGISHLVLVVFLIHGFGDVLSDSGKVVRTVAVKDATDSKIEATEKTISKVNKPAVVSKPALIEPVHEVTQVDAVKTVEPKLKVTEDAVTHEPVSPTTTTPRVTVTAEPVTTPATTVAPKPTPVPDVKGDWTLRYQNSTACARLSGELKLKINYKNETKGEQHEVEIAVPKSASVSGNCSTETMILSWPAEGIKNATKGNNIHFVFSLENSKNWKLANISGIVFLPTVFNSTTKFLETAFNSSSTSLFNAPVGMSYLCTKSNSYDLSVSSAKSNSTNATSGAVVFSQLQVEAFKPLNAKSDVFGAPNNCEMTPDMVPIAVGLALAGLVFIVLVAYLIAQRRPPAMGYRSV